MKYLVILSVLGLKPQGLPFQRHFIFKEEQRCLDTIHIVRDELKDKFTRLVVFCTKEPILD